MNNASELVIVKHDVLSWTSTIFLCCDFYLQKDKDLFFLLVYSMLEKMILSKNKNLNLIIFTYRDIFAIHVARQSHIPPVTHDKTSQLVKSID